jgi:hypothetical protein
MDIYDTIVSLCECKIAITYDETERKKIVLDGIRYQELQLEEMLSYLPSDHSDLIGCIKNLANLQNSIGLITEALTNYEKVVQIYVLQREPNFYSSAMIYGEASKMFIGQKEDYTSALHYKQKEIEHRVKHRAIKPDTTELGMNDTERQFSKNHQELPIK